MRSILLAISVTALVATALTRAPQAAPNGPYFYVVNSATRMMAEVFAHRTEVGSPVVLWPHYGGTSQQFTVQRLPNAPWQHTPEDELWFLLRARHSDKCLRTSGYHSGAPIVQAVCGGEAGQMWRVRQVRMTAADCPSGRCFAAFRNVLENSYDRGKRCLDAANGSFPAHPRQGAGLQAWNCIDRFGAPNAVNQEWELVNIQDWNAPGPVVR